MNYDRMEAGPEMDALVYEKVMGIKWDEKRCRVCGWELDVTGRLCRADDCSMRPLPKERADRIPPYSTDLMLAMCVFNQMSTYRKKIEGEIDGYMRSFYKPVLRLEWYEHDDDATFTIGRCKAVGEYPSDVRAYGKTIPVAICRGALKAVSE